MRKLFPAVQSFLIVGGLYGSPIFMALFGSLAPTLEVAPPPVPRAAFFQLSLSDAEEAGREEDDVPGAQNEAQGETLQGGSGSSSTTRKSASSPGSLAVVSPAASDARPSSSLAAKAMTSVGKRPSKRVRKKQRRRKRRKCLDGTDDITEVGHNRYAVERDLVDYYAKDLEALSRLARVKWHEDEAGKVDGFEVRRVRCGSVLYEAGLRNGDVVHAVNGRRIRSLARAIPLWWQIRRRPVVHVRITRGDDSMRLWYRLS